MGQRSNLQKHIYNYILNDKGADEYIEEINKESEEQLFNKERNYLCGPNAW